MYYLYFIYFSKNISIEKIEKKKKDSNVTIERVLHFAGVGAVFESVFDVRLPEELNEFTNKKNYCNYRDNNFFFGQRGTTTLNKKTITAICLAVQLDNRLLLTKKNLRL